MIVAILNKRPVKKRRNRKVWVRKWIAQRDSMGAYGALLQELRLEDAEGYRKYLRMNTECFEVWTILSIILHINKYIYKGIWYSCIWSALDMFKDLYTTKN